MARKPYNTQSAPPILVTRGGPAYTPQVPEFLPWAGVDQGDGTAAALVSTGSGGGGATNGIVITTTPITAGADAVQITQSSPFPSRFEAIVQNTGGTILWVGDMFVTDQNGANPGWPIAPGQRDVFPIAQFVALFGYCSPGATSTMATVMEFQ